MAESCRARRGHWHRVWGGHYRAAKSDVEAADYAQREYGVTRNQVAAFEKATERRYRKAKKEGKLVRINPGELKKLLE